MKISSFFIIGITSIVLVCGCSTNNEKVATSQSTQRWQSLNIKEYVPATSIVERIYNTYSEKGEVIGTQTETIQSSPDQSGNQFYVTSVGNSLGVNITKEATYEVSPTTLTLIKSFNSVSGVRNTPSIVISTTGPWEIEKDRVFINHDAPLQKIKNDIFLVELLMLNTQFDIRTRSPFSSLVL